MAALVSHCRLPSSSVMMAPKFPYILTVGFLKVMDCSRVVNYFFWVPSISELEPARNFYLCKGFNIKAIPTNARCVGRPLRFGPISCLPSPQGQLHHAGHCHPRNPIRDAISGTNHGSTLRNGLNIRHPLCLACTTVPALSPRNNVRTPNNYPQSGFPPWDFGFTMESDARPHRLHITIVSNQDTAHHFRQLQLLDGASVFSNVQRRPGQGQHWGVSPSPITTPKYTIPVKIINSPRPTPPCVTSYPVFNDPPTGSSVPPQHPQYR